MNEDEAVEEGVDEGAAIRGGGAASEGGGQEGRPSRRAVVAWLVLFVGAVALDGPVGGAVAVVVAAVLLAGASTQVIGALGVVSLLAAPIAVIAGGVPSSSEISPSFVSRSLVPHHLTFAGLLLVSVWVVIDLAPHLVRTSRHDPPPAAPGGEQLVAVRPHRTVALALVGVVAVAAIVASLAVLQA